MARSQTELKKFLQYGEHANADNPIDEASLTDKELNARLQGFQELGQTKGEIDPAGLQRELEQKLKSYGSDPKYAYPIARMVIESGKFPTPSELIDKFGYEATGGEKYTVTGRKLKPSLPPELLNFFNDQDVRNQFSANISNQVNAPGLTQDIKRVKDLIEERGRISKGNQDIQAFLGELPKTLAGETGQFMDVQRANAETQLRDFLDPQIRQSLAARGLLTSGDLSAELAGAGEQLQSGLNQQRIDLQAQDAAFFENAAYQVNLKKVLDANQNLSQEVNFQRGNALNQQENRFQVSQQNQADSFGLDTFRRQQEQNLTAQNQRLRQQQDITRRQLQASTIGNIGRYGGMIAGAALAAPTGGLSLAAGAGLGYTSGGVLSDIYTADSFRKT